MDKITLKYRTWYKGIVPRKIKLKIGEDGWAGDSHDYRSGAKPQPWHCLPFVEGSTYGLELIYPFETECKVFNNNGKVEFQGDFEKERPNMEVKWPPFLAFAPSHYGFTSSLDLNVPEGYVVRLEPHPKYFTDMSYTTPCVVPGHIQAEWWSRIFFIVFKIPPDGQYHIFRKSEPYAQILIVPKKVDYDIVPMTENEIKERSKFETIFDKADQHMAKKRWIDNTGHHFNDKYKVAGSVFAKKGLGGVKEFLLDCEMKYKNSKEIEHQLVVNKMKRIFVPKRIKTKETFLSVK